VKNTAGIRFNYNYMIKHLRSSISMFLMLLLVVIVVWKFQSNEYHYRGKTDNTLRRRFGGDPPFLNAILRTGVTAQDAMLYMNHYLVEWDFELSEYVPRLAESFDISPDGLDYTFNLREDVRWHDNEVFDADDVMYSFNTVMNPEVKAGYARANYLDSRIVDTLPEGDGQEKVEAAEYLAVYLEQLPVLKSAPVMDGSAEVQAQTLIESTTGSLRAAIYGDSLYLVGSRIPQHDTTIFVANHPGKMVRYGPSSQVAEWSGYLIADCGNQYPYPTGMYGKDGEIPSATFAMSEMLIEGLVPLHALLELGAASPLPATISLCLTWVDDVQLTRLDQYAVRFHFPRRNYQNLANAGQLRLVAEHYYNDGLDFMTHPKVDIPMGLGPYKFVRWDRGDLIEMERWEGYWGKKPPIKRVQFKLIPDSVVAFQVLCRGDLDVMQISVWTYTYKCDSSEFTEHFRKLDYYRPGYGFVSYNSNRSFFADKRCRQAMSHLIDVESAMEHLQLGINKAITGPHFWREGAYDHSLPIYEYSPEKAMELLDEAGWIDNDGDGIREKDLNGDGIISREPLDAAGNQREIFSFDVLWGGSGIAVQNNWIPLSLQRNCAKVGLKCGIRNIEGSVKLQWLKNGDFDCTSGSWVLELDHDPTPFFHSTQANDGFNFNRFNDPVADNLLETARRELDKEKRTEIFRQFHHRIWEQQPYTFTYSHNWRWALNHRIKNATTYDMGFDYLKWELEHD
jgi:ABC-type transport system substrate-binding protein